MSECKGLFYRCRIETYMSSSGELVNVRRMRPLPSRSCKGCDTCAKILDTLYDKPDAVSAVMVHGALYRLWINERPFKDEPKLDFELIEL